MFPPRGDTVFRSATFSAVSPQLTRHAAHKQKWVFRCDGRCLRHRPPDAAAAFVEDSDASHQRSDETAFPNEIDDLNEITVQIELKHIVAVTLMPSHCGRWEGLQPTPDTECREKQVLKMDGSYTNIILVKRNLLTC